ncbi:MAG: putative domain HDIG-containing protein [Proteobacteria bacterium]|nr:putative domain HDIG-containing protein [Pseudomonadota bacterium]
MNSPPVPASIDPEFLHSLSVLYVEDEEDVRNALAHYLRRRFANVDVAANGREGLDLFRRSRQDVVITDIKMPVMDGLEMAAEIKTIVEDVPVIVVTAYNETDYFLRAIEIGIDRYVKKPINPDELMEAVQKSTQVHMQQKALEMASLRLLKTLEHTVGALSRAIEKRDPYTDGHQKRVSQMAIAIAESMGLPKEQITGVRMGALVHDIGNIAIPTEILTMPRKLTTLEFNFIKRHPEAGADILRDIEFPWPISQIVEQHHERLDGSGYPNSLKGDEILLESRIIAVADVIEAMASHRPYRPSLGVEAAISEITEQRDVLYDPDVVDCCLSLLERGQLLPA